MKRSGIITFILLLLLFSMPVCAFGDETTVMSKFEENSSGNGEDKSEENDTATGTNLPDRSAASMDAGVDEKSGTNFKLIAGIACGSLLVIGLLAVLFLKLRDHDNDNQDDDYDDLNEGKGRAASSPQHTHVGANSPVRANGPVGANGPSRANGPVGANGPAGAGVSAQKDGTEAPEESRPPKTGQPNRVVMPEIVPSIRQMGRESAVQGMPAPVRLQIEEIMGSFYGRGTVFTFDKELVVGSDRKCDIVFTDNGVSPRHARIYRLDGRLFIEDLGSDAGTYLDGMRLFSNNPLRDGDAIGIGEAGFVVRL